jgi:hypothetical protein
MAHSARNSMNVLWKMFPAHVISWNGLLQWPARFPNLSACGYFLWGYLKSKVYVNCLTAMTVLKKDIREETVAIAVEMT